MLHISKARVLLGVLLVIELKLLYTKENCGVTELANGTVHKIKYFLKPQCNTNFLHFGSLLLKCSPDGRIKGERPFCAMAGCVPPTDPDNGRIDIEHDAKAVVICMEEYAVAGNAFAFCNGQKWDRTLGVCRHRNHTQDHACDFESVDICGWSNQLDKVTTWHRNTTEGNFYTAHTGPRFDHTQLNINGGHYMLMETADLQPGVHHLVSPIYSRELSLKTACCFRFHYLMYGSGVGDLIVSVKPDDMHVDAMWKNEIGRKFNISGNQNFTWREQTISIDEMSQDFQIVITARSTGAPHGDIAIDDVSLLTGSDCLKVSVASVPTIEKSASQKKNNVDRKKQPTNTLLVWILVIFIMLIIMVSAFAVYRLRSLAKTKRISTQNMGALYRKL